jgi:hypothetical protein
VELTAVGALVVALGLIFGLTSQRRLVQCIVFFASFSGTAVVNFGDYGMAPDLPLLGFLIAGALLSGRLMQPARMSTDHLTAALLIISFAVIVVMSLLWNGGLRGLPSIQLTQTAYLLFGVFLTLVLSIELSQPDRLEAGVGALRASATFISFWGLFQWACYYAHITYPAFLFNNSTSHFADMYDQRATEGVVRIASVATEPSFMAISLMIFGAFGATVLLHEPQLRTRGWIVAVFATLATVALSTSTTGYFGIAVLALLLARRRPGTVLVAGIIVGLIAAVVLASSPDLRDGVYNMTLGKISGGTYMERTSTFAPAMKRFEREPWIGTGWGTDFSYSIVTLMLANAGILGSAAFLIAVGATLAASRAARAGIASGPPYLATYAEAAENAMIVYLANSAVSGFKYVVADSWCLWAFALAIPTCLARLAESAPAPGPGLRGVGSERAQSGRGGLSVARRRA